MNSIKNSNKIIVSCSTSQKLSNDVAEKSQIPQIQLLYKAYSCSEIKLKLEDSFKLKDKKIIIFQGLRNSVNDAIYELLQAIDLIIRSEPQEIIVFLPYLYYSRQDKNPKNSQGLQLLLLILHKLGIKKLVTIDIHSQFFLKNNLIEIISLNPTKVFLSHIQNNYLSGDIDITTIAPDAGGVLRAKALADLLNSNLLTLNKKRINDKIFYEKLKSQIPSENIYIIIDDIIDSGDTLIMAADALYMAGAKNIIAYCTHGIFSDDSYKIIENSKIQTLYITNSIDRFSEEFTTTKIKQLNISDLIIDYLEII